jgi:hypothetical protein
LKQTLFPLALLMLLASQSACSTPSPYATTIGVLKPGATLRVRIASGVLNAYQPLTGGRRDLFTISALVPSKATPPPAPRLHSERRGLAVDATGALASLLVRVPDRVALAVESQHGNVNVTDITGSVRVMAHDGNVDVKVPGYAQASAGNGNVKVMMGAAEWPGTLFFSSQRGDVEVWISAKAAFRVHLHTNDGVLFTDFALRGTSNGRAETIDGSVNGGGAQTIDAETDAGAIRLMRLAPQP